MDSPKRVALTVYTDLDHAAFLEQEAAKRGISVPDLVEKHLPRPPEPPPEEFEFTGVIVVISRYAFGGIRVCFDQDKGHGWGFFNPEYLSKAEWKWLLEGARVKGRAIAPPKHGDISKILWLDSNESIFLEQSKEVSWLRSLKALLKRLAWRFDTKSRKAVRVAAIESHKKRFPELEAAGA